MEIKFTPLNFIHNLNRSKENEKKPDMYEIQEESIEKKEEIGEDLYDIDVKVKLQDINLGINPPDGDQCHTLKNCKTPGSQCCYPSAGFTLCRPHC